MAQEGLHICGRWTGKEKTISISLQGDQLRLQIGASPFLQVAPVSSEEAWPKRWSVVNQANAKEEPFQLELGSAESATMWLRHGASSEELTRAGAPARRG
ncbi:unnamed protein product [Effrenium voratum]|uniref:Uncharacterized protein n=1 Tax=Effrenium voratum TaxID=2562239 RepID=A0AA36N4S8_9DINO|nr:unnamed protein product [Effrenium voratum]CAJ1431416.1 unnamed protein product [Effrenium voratum]